MPCSIIFWLADVESIKNGRVIIITLSRGEDGVLLKVRKVEALLLPLLLLPLLLQPAAKLSRLENCLNQTSLSETL